MYTRIQQGSKYIVDNDSQNFHSMKRKLQTRKDEGYKEHWSGGLGLEVSAETQFFNVYTESEI